MTGMGEWRHRQVPSIGSTADVLGFSQPSFTLLRDLIAQRTGVQFDDNKRDLLADKLAELVAEHGMTSYLDYYYLLRYDDDAQGHWTELMNRLAVPETFFWRQADQIEALASTVVPAFAAAYPGATLRIWSAACCTGEEPISLAIALAESGWLDRIPIEISASDGSPALLARARAGVYGERSFRNLPSHLRDRYFHRHEGGWRVDERIASRIHWTRANLVVPEEVAPLATANVVFCRNVFIYFSDETIERVVNEFARHMRDPAHLFIGASESLTRLATDFELDEVGGAFVYTRRSAGARAASRRAIMEAAP